MRRLAVIGLVLLTPWLAGISFAQPGTSAPAVVGAFDVTTDGTRLYLQTPENRNGTATIAINGADSTLVLADGGYEWEPADNGLFLFTSASQNKLYHVSRRNDGSIRLRYLPLWLSLLPPLIAIGMALLLKEVIVSLFVGIWVGSFIAGGLRIDSAFGLLQSLLEVVAKYVVNALNDFGHLSVIVFSLLIGGMVAIISRNGGMTGVVLRLSKYAKSPSSAQLVTWILGVAIFFDDYANTLIVGNTMRSVTDRFRISREKLAYIVDSTAAPVASVAFITTWIGAELGYIGDGVANLEGWPPELTPYAVFLESLKYSFYPVLTLIFILFIVRMGRDYGPMLAAEIRARTTGELYRIDVEEDDAGEGGLEDLSPVKNAPYKARNAVIPVLVVILMTIFGLLDTGFDGLAGQLAEQGITTKGWGSTWANVGALYTAGESPNLFMKLGRVIGAADSYIALLWASLSGVVVALLLTVLARIMSLERTIGTLANGFKTMLPAVMILTLAWALAITTEELHTAVFLTGALSGNLSPYLLPPIIFVLAALISFSTGSSWSTMAILYPIAIPLTWNICQEYGIDSAHTLELMFNVISIVLGASVLGDHCSPISDTTILSSLASDCHHIDHVRTQLPYALSVGSLSILAGFLATLLGGGWAICSLLLLLGIAAAYAIVRFVGRRVTDEIPAA
jgi:Na+/H+ antiporter NhaC